MSAHLSSLTHSLLFTSSQCARLFVKKFKSRDGPLERAALAQGASVGQALSAREVFVALGAAFELARTEAEIAVGARG